MLFSVVTIPIYIPINSVKVFPILQDSLQSESSLSCYTDQNFIFTSVLLDCCLLNK